MEQQSFPFQNNEHIQKGLETDEFVQTKDNHISLLKPSGKLKFKSAQRFFRMEMVPILKKLEPTLDSQGRQDVIKQLWSKLQDHHKLAYVLLSRADREKTLYVARLNQIREELRRAYPEEYDQEQNRNSTRSSTAGEDSKGSFQNNGITSFNEKMHGMQALERIEERIYDEINSDNDDQQSNEQSSQQLAQDTFPSPCLNDVEVLSSRDSQKSDKPAQQQKNTYQQRFPMTAVQLQELEKKR